MYIHFLILGTLGTPLTYVPGTEVWGQKFWHQNTVKNGYDVRLRRIHVTLPVMTSDYVEFTSRYVSMQV